MSHAAACALDTEHAPAASLCWYGKPQEAEHALEVQMLVLEHEGLVFSIAASTRAAASASSLAGAQ